MFQPGHLGEEGIVSPGGLRAALDHVTGDDGTGQGVPVGLRPPVVPGGRPHHQRGIGHSRADHHVGTRSERLDDGPGTEIGVGRDHLARCFVKVVCGVQVGQGVAGRGQLVDAGEEVVAFDVGHRHRKPQAFGQETDLVGQSRRIEAAGVGHHLDAAVDAGAEHLLHLGQEGVGAAPGRVALEPLPQDEHGQLGQPVPGEDVDGTALHHLAGGRQAVAVEARAVGDAQRRSHEAVPPLGVSSSGR